MIRIGICNGSREDGRVIERLCSRYLDNIGVKYQFVNFLSGERLLKYCADRENRRIDLLFLDVKLPGINGIEVKRRAERINGIWRIVFVSECKEYMQMAFGLKTLGFVTKPLHTGEIVKYVRHVLEEMGENLLLQIEGLRDGIRVGEIVFIEGDGSYSVIHLRNGKESRVIARNLKYIEGVVGQLPIIRVHKSYMVNLQHVSRLDKQVVFKDDEFAVPVGRAYREEAEREFGEYLDVSIGRVGG